MKTKEPVAVRVVGQVAGAAVGATVGVALGVVETLAPTRCVINQHVDVQVGQQILSIPVVERLPGLAKTAMWGIAGTGLTVLFGLNPETWPVLGAVVGKLAVSAPMAGLVAGAGARALKNVVVDSLAGAVGVARLGSVSASTVRDLELFNPHRRQRMEKVISDLQTQGYFPFDELSRNDAKLLGAMLHDENHGLSADDREFVLDALQNGWLSALERLREKKPASHRL